MSRPSTRAWFWTMLNTNKAKATACNIPESKEKQKTSKGYCERMHSVDRALSGEQSSAFRTSKTGTL